MPFLDALVHRATPWSRVPDGEWVEGERVTDSVEGVPFDCVLFLPQGTESAGPRTRKVREPTLLYAPEDDRGGVVGLFPEDEVDVIAPELNRAEGWEEDRAVRWQVVGAPQPFGKPGDDVIGFQATLRRIDD